MHKKTVTREVEVTVVDAEDVRYNCIEMLHSDAAFQVNPTMGSACVNTAQDDPNRHCLAAHLAITFGSTSPRFREVASRTFEGSYDPDQDMVEFTVKAQNLLSDLQMAADDRDNPAPWGIAIARVFLVD